MTDTTNPARLDPGRAGLGNGQHLTAYACPAASAARTARSRTKRPHDAGNVVIALWARLGVISDLEDFEALKVCVG